MRTRRSSLNRWMATTGLITLTLLLTQCSDDPTGPVASSITIVSGNNQLSLKGNTLPELLVVAVKTNDGTAAEDVVVNFTPISGGGSVSPSQVATSSRGQAATRLTLGPGVGINRVRASVSGADGTESVIFTATSANFFCEEANDTLKVCDGCPDAYGTRGVALLATAKSSLFDPPSAGIVQVNIAGNNASAREFTELPAELNITTVIWDLAFSARGDLFLARRAIGSEIVKISPAGAVSRFSGLEAVDLDDAVELDTNPSGLLVGVDKRGPFVVECDALRRFAEAEFPTGGINVDALAVDPRRQGEDALGEDIYFIDNNTGDLLRLAMDSLRVEPLRGLETVTPLSLEEANSARGMVCDRDGTVFILVDSNNTKAILRVTTAGTKTTEFDFKTQRGADDVSGTGGNQSDLAIDRNGRRLYTLDTLNNLMLLYNVDTQLFTPKFAAADSIEQIKLSEVPPVGERVGLAVMP